MGQVTQPAPNAGQPDLTIKTTSQHRSTHLTLVEPIELVDAWPSPIHFKVLSLYFSLALGKNQ